VNPLVKKYIDRLDQLLADRRSRGPLLQDEESAVAAELDDVWRELSDEDQDFIEFYVTLGDGEPVQAPEDLGLVTVEVKLGDRTMPYKAA